MRFARATRCSGWSVQPAVRSVPGPVVARIIEPTSKVDWLGVLVETGVETVFTGR
jgi:hypothetical protein